jgi:hypothetical protein
MEMQQIRYFLSLAGTLNCTRAAEECNVSQSAASMPPLLFFGRDGSSVRVKDRKCGRTFEMLKMHGVHAAFWTGRSAGAPRGRQRMG